MHKFHHRPGKSAVFALLLLAFAANCLFYWWAKGGLLPALIGLLLAAGAAKLLSDAFSDTPALEIRPEGVSIRKTWGGLAQVPWGQVQHMSVEVMTLRYFGIIPVARHETLVVKCDGGVFGSRRLRLALKMVELPPGGTAGLMHLLHHYHVSAVGETGIAMAGAGEHGWGARSVPSLGRAEPSGLEPAEGSPDFDADAALARYLARKEAGVAGPASAPSARAPQPAAAPLPPARPVFGRKSHAG